MDQSWTSRSEEGEAGITRKLGCIYFIDPEDGEFQETVENASKKLEVPMEAAMPYNKMGTKKRPNKWRETDDSNNMKA